MVLKPCPDDDGVSEFDVVASIMLIQICENDENVSSEGGWDSPFSSANPIDAAAPNSLIFGSNNISNNSRGGSQHLAMDMGGGNPRGSAPCWRSPYSNPELEYVYLGSPQSSQGSPQVSMLQPEHVITNNPYVLQPAVAAGNSYDDHGQFTFAAAAAPVANCSPPWFMPVSGVNLHSPSFHQGFAAPNNPQSQSQPQSQPLHPLRGESMQFDDIWSSLDSDLLDRVTPEDISMVEAYAPPGFDRSRLAVQPVMNYNTWAMDPQAIPEEAQSCNRAGNTVTYAHPQEGGGQHHYGDVMANQQPAFTHGIAPASAQGFGSLLSGPQLDFLDVVTGDTISESFSSTSPAAEQSLSHAHVPYGFGHPGNGNAGTGNLENGSRGNGSRDNGNRDNVRDPRARSSQPESGFREQARGGGVAVGGKGKSGEDEFMGDMLAPIRSLGEPLWAKQLLNLCASAIASKNISRTQHLMWVLNDLASVVGDANQRFAAYGLRALFCRITGRTEEAAATFMRPRHHDQEVSFGPRTVHRALVKFHEYLPWHQNCYSITSQTLLEVCAGKSRLHFIDIGVGKGIEWPIFIDALVSRSGGPPSILRMTMVRDLRREELNIGTAKSVNSEAADFMTRLVKFASLLGLHVEVNMVQKPLEYITREDLRVREGEVLAVVCQFRLHRLSEEVLARESNEPPPRLSPRDDFMAFLHKLQPHVFILSDNDSDHCSLDFLTRFQHCISFWWLCYEAMDISYAGRDPEERQIIEYEGSMMLLNTVACEGIARIERNDSYEHWQRRALRAGFVPRELSEESKKVSQNLVASHGTFWDVAFMGSNAISLRWRKQPTTFTSVWKAASSCSKPSCKCSMLHS